MKVALKLPKYKNMKLVTTVYGNDDPTDSAKATQGLISAYPNLAGHHLADDGGRRRPPHRSSSRRASAGRSS